MILAQNIMNARIWWALPLIVVISLVYGGTRHEYIGQILYEAYKSTFWIVGFMLLIFAVIWCVGFMN